MMVPFVDISRQYDWLESEINTSVQTVMKSGKYVLDRFNLELEKCLAEITNTNHAVTVKNGTDALIISLRLLGIGQGDEVIVPVNSFIASAGAVCAVGAKPCFVDVCDDHNMDPTLLIDCITEKTKAIIVVHLSGNPAKMHEIRTIADEFGLYIIEDSAQAIGAVYNGEKVGSLGHLAAFSLHPLKNISVMGDGGFISMSCPHLMRRAKLIRNHGLIDRNTSVEWGYNSRLDEMQAAIALVKLRHFGKITSAFIKRAQYYSKYLSGVVSIPLKAENTTCVYHNYMILCERRDDLIQHLSNHNIETKIHYPKLLCDLPAFRKLMSKPKKFPNAERLNKQKLSLPIYAEIREDEQLFVVEKIREFYAK